MRSILRYAQRALPRSQARSLHTTTTIGSLHSLYDPLQHAERLLKLSREVPSDEKIALAADVERITDLAQQQYGIDPEQLEPYGHYKAKVSTGLLNELETRDKEGKLILVTALTPTKAGEGKTCTSVGLADGMCQIGKSCMVALREPSLGPVFGMKGGAAGGGYAQVVPMADINLHFTGDMHAIGAAHNLCSAMVDNHIYWNKEPQIDARRVAWRRVVDMNDRALRSTTCGLGGPLNGFPRIDGFDITVASEVMAVFCLATDLDDLQRRLGNVVVGYTRTRKPVTAAEINADGAMTALLKDAMQPNLVQTLENNVAIVHGGPFANIAHGCSSVVATKAALKMSDYVITEAGFGADLGAEKFFDIKCRKAGLKPEAAVVVGTVRALKMHGGAKDDELAEEDLGALERGMPNLLKHVENVAKFGVPVIVAINRFPTDTGLEVDLIEKACEKVGVRAVMASHWTEGGVGAVPLAEEVVRVADSGEANFQPLYPDDMPLADKVRTIAQEIYGAADISVDKAAATKFRQFEKLGFGHFPVCMAKTQYSFSDDPNAKGAPTGHTLHVTDARLSAGAEFVVVLTGDIMTMPGLPKVPAAEAIGVSREGVINGLF